MVFQKAGCSFRGMHSPLVPGRTERSKRSEEGKSLCLNSETSNELRKFSGRLDALVSAQQRGERGQEEEIYCPRLSRDYSPATLRPGSSRHPIGWQQQKRGKGEASGLLTCVASPGVATVTAQRVPVGKRKRKSSRELTSIKTYSRAAL